MTALDVERALAMRLSDDRRVPSTAHIVLLAIVLLLIGAALPRPFLIWWAMVIIAIILLRTVLAGRATRPETDPASIVRTTRVVVVVLGLAWGPRSSRSPRRVWKWC